ncbi:SOS response-associated peptidase [Micromonospora sp. b486]|uniref:SOS response-associated peptidase n=1 Tax=Micromonospora sp. b486 TaxID=3053986 RepID=UPI00259CAD85|nr:SOS response-associated peptidase [Micromonospora sp. b486]MDM4784526.1 SOS response-associated peptidase [Micromonospora sp. b486]
MITRGRDGRHQPGVRAVFARRRCLVPADGWYEWVRLADGGRQPYFMTPRDGSVLAFAGIWSVWESAARPRLTFSVLTTSAVGELAEVHDRMPLLLSPERWAGWLGPAEEPAELLAPPDAGLLAGLEIRPVSPAVGTSATTARTDRRGGSGGGRDGGRADAVLITLRHIRAHPFPGFDRKSRRTFSQFH